MTFTERAIRGLISTFSNVSETFADTCFMDFYTKTNKVERGRISCFFAAVIVPIDWNIDCSKKPRKINETLCSRSRKLC